MNFIYLKPEFMMITIKMFFLLAVLELNNLLEKISRNSRAYFQFSKKSFEIWSEVLFKGSLRSKEIVN